MCKEGGREGGHEGRVIRVICGRREGGGWGVSVIRLIHTPMYMYVPCMKEGGRGKE